MTDEELIEQARAKLEERGVSFGDFWKIVRGSYTLVWFWGIPKGGPNYSVTFDKGKLLWCNV